MLEDRLEKSMLVPTGLKYCQGIVLLDIFIYTWSVSVCVAYME